MIAKIKNDSSVFKFRRLMTAGFEDHPYSNKSRERGEQATNKGVPVVVIVGGGFGGLAAAKALRKAKARVILIDRANHHLFQPLLYQVATSALAPGQIASPIRGILRNQKNATVILGEVANVEKTKSVFSSTPGIVNRCRLRMTI